MTKSKDLIIVIKDMVQPVIDQFSLELMDIEYTKEGKERYLRIYIDKEGGVTIDDCVDVTRELNKLIDKTDPIKESYILEVSSPGLDRPLKTERDFEKYKGQAVEVKLYKPLNGIKLFEGSLEGRTEEKIKIKNDHGDVLEFAGKDVSTVRRKITI